MPKFNVEIEKTCRVCGTIEIEAVSEREAIKSARNSGIDDPRIKWGEPEYKDDSLAAYGGAYLSADSISWDVDGNRIEPEPFCLGCGGKPDGSDPGCNCPMCRNAGLALASQEPERWDGLS